MTTTMYDDRPCQLGEGPLWHPERQQFFWFDITGKRLLSRKDDEQLDWQFKEQSSAAGWIDSQTLLIATETGLRRFDIESGAHELVVPLEPGNSVTRSNDGRADPMGGFWIGTMGKNAEAQAGAIYRFHRGAVERLVSQVTVPNAMCFSPDGRLAYYADTVTEQIMVQPLDAEGWPEGPAEVFVDLRQDGLKPDGAVVDSEGGLWNAHWGAGQVARYRPDGTFDRAIKVPGSQSTCPAFGGPELDIMYITTARQGLSDPDAAQGLTYSTNPGVMGQAEHKVIA
ncbi:SMP-30/gluconolactonase/LRE family protein [Chachezhania antarctica]|uniref:SMP-30/gluconolactonase/LRE family protein n=1 Tax=Chachezhania antarctica TaxID=2340860 RepID=UPI000EB5C9E7|nr:SMP-30/gluconolactonase/LRE family protein [Chachezhania antarctica]